MLAKKRTENLKILCPFPFVLDFTALSQINVRGLFCYLRSFFSVKNSARNGKICLQSYFKRVFESILHSGARGYSKVYARRILALWACQARYSWVRIPPYAIIAYRQWFGLSFGTQKMTRTISCAREHFCSGFVIIWQSEKCFATSRRAMQKQALPENGYRVIPNSAKRFLSALCRRHSNSQPPLLHEW